MKHVVTWRRCFESRFGSVFRIICASRSRKASKTSVSRQPSLKISRILYASCNWPRTRNYLCLVSAQNNRKSHRPFWHVPEGQYRPGYTRYTMLVKRVFLGGGQNDCQWTLKWGQGDKSRFQALRLCRTGAILSYRPMHKLSDTLVRL